MENEGIERPPDQGRTIQPDRSNQPGVGGNPPLSGSNLPPAGGVQQGGSGPADKPTSGPADRPTTGPGKE